MAGIYMGLRAEDLRARARALERFAEWQTSAPANLSPEVALSGVAMLFELLSPSSRLRQFDPSGVAALHRALSVLGRARR